MKLADVFLGIPVLSGGAAGDLEISGIAYNSKAVRPGFLFAALRGAAQNGMDFVAEAEANGAAAVLSAWPKPPAGRAAWIQVADAREALALAAANFHGHPSDRMKVVGVTGTKGKTTTTYLLEEILRAAGTAPGVIGTIEYRRPGWKIPAPRTTPEAPDLQALLGEMLGAGVSHCVMEVSSHALEQKRVWGVGFDVAVFTNLSGEHLDYHPSMEDYFEAKKKLFVLNHKKRAAVVNMDDPWGQRLVAELPMTTVTFGLEPAAIVRALKFVLSEAGIDAQVAYPGGVMRLQSTLVGRHNLYNMLAAAAAALALNVAPADIVKGVAALAGVPGRFERVPNDRGIQVVVDYAHTDNALEHVLMTAREFKPRRIVLVFGAGGDRDRDKRERMGRVAARLADWTVLTSDNPRSEEPGAIIADIEAGFVREAVKTYEIEPDRRKAIVRALATANKGDIVIIAGKGHEDYQVFKDRTVHFSDVEVAAEITARERGGLTVAVLSLDDIARTTGGDLLQGSPALAFDRFGIDSRLAAAGELFFAVPGKRDGHDFVVAAAAAGAAGAVVSRPVPDAPPGLRSRPGPGHRGRAPGPRPRGPPPPAGQGRRHHRERRQDDDQGLHRRPARPPLPGPQVRGQLQQPPRTGPVPPAARTGPRRGRPGDGHERARRDPGPHSDRPARRGRHHQRQPGPPAVLPEPRRDRPGQEGDPRRGRSGRDGRPQRRRPARRPDRRGLRRTQGRPSAGTRAADVRAEAVAPKGFAGFEIDLRCGEERGRVRFPFVNEAAVANLLAAAAVAHALGLRLGEIAPAAESLGRPPGAASWSRPAGGVRIYDDSYNSNPRALEAALRSLAALPAGAQSRRPGRHAGARDGRTRSSTARRATPSPAAAGTSSSPSARSPPSSPKAPSRQVWIRPPSIASPTPGPRPRPSQTSSGTATSFWSKARGA